MTAFDLKPTLRGKSIILRPLEPDDFEALYKAASDPLIWEQHPDSLRYKRDVFEKNFFSGAISNGALAVQLNSDNSIIGCSRYYDWQPEKQEIAIGYTFLERAFWGSNINREMKSLMLAHAFKQAEVVWFHIGKDNLRSRKAVEKLGATLSHEEEISLHGISFVQVYYKLCAPHGLIR